MTTSDVALLGKCPDGATVGTPGQRGQLATVWDAIYLSWYHGPFFVSGCVCM